MSRAALLVLFGLLVRAPAAFASPPEGPSGRVVQDAVPALAAEVKRLEKEVARAPELADELNVARARLATAQGRTGAARAAWRKVIAAREELVARCETLLAKGVLCDPSDLTLYRGAVAEARCGLAEVEGDRAALARELPKGIAYHEAMLRRLDELRKKGAYEPRETEEERAIRKELHQARQRLDALKRQ
jgi:hypothetical protein